MKKAKRTTKAKAVTSGDMTIKDSGERRVFATGAQRDRGSGKGAFHLLPWHALLEVAKVFEVGALKYTKNNYRLGMHLSEYVNSALRHAIKAGQGWDDEPHAAQAAWNMLCFIETQAMIRAGHLPKELDDIDNWLTSEGVAKALDLIRQANLAKAEPVKGRSPVKSNSAVNRKGSKWTRSLWARSAPAN